MDLFMKINTTVGIVSLVAGFIFPPLWGITVLCLLASVMVLIWGV